jgi:Na+:H+ antiporter, NhaA family
MRRQPAPAAHWSETPIARVIGPMQDFIHREQSSGILLLIMTALALVLANSPLGADYFALLETKTGFVFGSLELKMSVLHWINDGLMVIFFFVVGLEIKREILAGELANPRAAALPILAATGGAIVPALIYVALNGGQPSARGWGIPMATDIAFALGCLALLGSRVPFGLKIFLTAVAIVDDMIAVLVIAIFYAEQLNMIALGAGLGLLALLYGANRLGIRQPLVYALVGLLVWLAFLQSGVHATIAGVLLAMTVPARVRIDGATFVGQARGLLEQFEAARGQVSPILVDATQQAAVHEIEELAEQVQAPLQRLEHGLHGWVALLIMPIFALANAGVALSTEGLGAEAPSIMLGIAVGLLLGKPIGIMVAAWLAVRLGVADLPQGASWMQMLGIGVLAGIGFTMSLFIASLGFAAQPESLAAAKIAVLGASTVAGVVGVLLLAQMAGRAGEVPREEQAAA